MNVDLVFIIILTVLLLKALPPKNKWDVGDYIGGFMATFLVYILVKALPHCLIGGWTFPVNPDPKIHLISGSIAFVLVGSLWLLTGYCKKNDTNVWQILKLK
jgi:hypothetical protein